MLASPLILLQLFPNLFHQWSCKKQSTAPKGRPDPGPEPGAVMRGSWSWKSQGLHNIVLHNVWSHFWPFLRTTQQHCLKVRKNYQVKVDNWSSQSTRARHTHFSRVNHVSAWQIVVLFHAGKRAWILEGVFFFLQLHVKNKLFLHTQNLQSI